MVPLLDLVFGVLLPGLLCALGLLWVPSARRKDPIGQPADRPVIGAVLFAGGVWIAHLQILGWPPRPGGEAVLTLRDWTPWFALAAAVLAPLGHWRHFGRFAWKLAILVGLVIVWNAAYQPEDLPLSVLFLGLLCASVWGSIDAVATRVHGPALAASLAIAGTGIAVCALLAHSGLVAQQTGSLCACLGGAAVALLLRPNSRLPSGALAVAIPLFANAALTASVYGMPPASGFLLVIALLVGWIVRLEHFGRMRPIPRTLAAMALTAIPVGAAIGIAYAARSTSSGY